VGASVRQLLRAPRTPQHMRHARSPSKRMGGGRERPPDARTISHRYHERTLCPMLVRRTRRPLDHTKTLWLTAHNAQMQQHALRVIQYSAIGERASNGGWLRPKTCHKAGFSTYVTAHTVMPCLPLVSSGLGVRTDRSTRWPACEMGRYRSDSPPHCCRGWLSRHRLIRKS